MISQSNLTKWFCSYAGSADHFPDATKMVSFHASRLSPPNHCRGQAGELQEGSVVKESLTTAADGKAYTIHDALRRELNSQSGTRCVPN